MPNIFLISDTHFGHESTITKFKRSDGSPLRDFKDVNHMNETMIANWNSVVRPQDKIYHLGDIGFGNRHDFDILMKRLNGHKRLVRGNHDMFDTKEYMKHFDDIYGVRVLDHMLLTHVPVHTDCLEHRFGYNIHGHLHMNKVKMNGKGEDPRYINVSVEQIDYTPIALEDLRKKYCNVY